VLNVSLRSRKDARVAWLIHSTDWATASLYSVSENPTTGQGVPQLVATLTAHQQMGARPSICQPGTA
jgi:hypothetical protein